MAIRNRPFSESNDPNFDLDQYIREKSGDETYTPYSEPEVNRSERSKWMRTTMVLAAAAIFALLYFNNWSISQVYGNIFGVEELQETHEEPAIADVNAELESLAARISEEVNQALDEAELSQELQAARLADRINRELEAAELAERINAELEAAELTARINNQLEAANISEEIEEAFREADINNTIQEAFREAGLISGDVQEFSTNLEALTENSVQLALESALAALEGLAELEALGGLEALEELENIGNSEVLFLDSYEPNTLRISDYSREFSRRSLGTFSDEQIQELHDANVPIELLETLDDMGVLSNFNTNQIIELYEMRDNQ